MKIKPVSGIMLILVLIGTLTLAFYVLPIDAGGTIFIRADGGVDPPTAPISSVDHVTYTFTDNIYDEIVVERDGIIIDGAGYTVQGTGIYAGIDLSYRSNVTLKKMKVINFVYGIYLDYSSNNILIGNTVSNNHIGICAWAGSNILVGNTALKNNFGIYLFQSSNNTIFHNNLINNGFEANGESGYVNTWDGGYPSGGNYWSKYTGVDFYSGPYQNITGSDGIGDTPYTICEDNQDRYPLMEPYTSCDVDGNGQIDILDLKKVKLAYSGLIEWPPADVNGDRKTDILDVKLVKLAYSGIL